MLHRKIAVIFAADIAGYARLVAENEEETLARLDSVRRIAEGLINQAGGRIFNTAGDAIMAEFKSAVNAVRCALDIQSSLRAGNENYPPARQMWFRIGVTIGDVFEREGDLLGDGVNIAARLESIGPEGGVCISRSVYEVVANKVTARFSDRGLQRLKNIPEPIHVYSLMGFETSVFPGKSPSRIRWAWAAALVVLGAAGGGAYFIARLEKPSVAAKTTPDVVQEPAPPVESVAPKPSGPSPESEARARQLERCFNEPAPVAISLCGAIAAENRLSSALQAKVELRLGTLLRENHDAKGAVEALTQSISHAPTSAAFNQRGIAEFELGQMEKAIADFNDALRIDANNGEALNNRAWTYYKAN
ncbi:MAG: adenylate/guanylate cyclase domain-containing protein, partial [Methylocystis sp.]